MQSGMQCISRTLRDHNRSPLPPYFASRDSPGYRPGATYNKRMANTTYIKQHPQSPMPELGKAKMGALLIPPKSELRSASAQSPLGKYHSSMSGASEGEGEQRHAYVRHYGASRNYNNE